MTSVISPWLYAAQLATQAQQRLSTAGHALDGADQRPTRPVDGDVHIPELDGPDSHDNPWFARPEPSPATGFARAKVIAGFAITSIDSALALGTVLSPQVRTAFSAARDQARLGVELITSQTLRAPTGGEVKLQFDSASMWLGLAKQLLSLEHGTPSDDAAAGTLPTADVG